MNRAARNITVAAFLILGLVGLRVPDAGAQITADVSSHPWIGKAAPDFFLKQTGSEGKMRLSDLKGKYVVIHFGASW